MALFRGKPWKQRFHEERHQRLLDMLEYGNLKDSNELLRAKKRQAEKRLSESERRRKRLLRLHGSLRRKVRELNQKLACTARDYHQAKHALENERARTHEAMQQAYYEGLKEGLSRRGESDPCENPREDSFAEDPEQAAEDMERDANTILQWAIDRLERERESIRNGERANTPVGYIVRPGLPVAYWSLIGARDLYKGEGGE